MEQTEKQKYFQGYYEARRNKLRHIRQSFVQFGKHEDNKCVPCRTKKLLEWRENVR